MTDYAVIGRSAPRRDTLEKVTGQARYTLDVTLPGMIHAQVLRSPWPHARIRSIDASAAEALPGVRAVLTHQNTINTLFSTAATMMALPTGHQGVLDQRIFDSTVRFVGDEVAAVAADTLEIAAKALKLIEVDYEILPFVLDPEEAEKPESIALHPDKPELQYGHNVPGHPVEIKRGDVEKALAEADEVVELTFNLKPVKQMQMETMGAVAQVEGSGKINVWSTTQTTHPARAQLAHIFKIPTSRIRVMNPPYVGGGFGSRIGLSAKAEVIAVALALASRKPVKLTYTRTEDMIATDTRHGGQLKLRLGAKKDGTLTALDLRARLNKGAYCSFGHEIYGTTGHMNLSLYQIPNLYFKGYSVYTNTTTAGAYRGFGNPQGNLTVERGIEMMAARLGLDPLELRRKNATQKGGDYVLPYPCDSNAIQSCMTKGAESIGWHKRAEYNADKSGRLRRGLGMAIGTHYSNGFQLIVDYESAYITVQPDGSVNVATPISDIGTGCNTAVAQMAAEALGVPLESVFMIYADTDSTPFGYGAHSSRIVYAHGIAVAAAAREVRQKILEYAAGLCGRRAEELDLKCGMVRAKDGAASFPAELRRRQLFQEPGYAPPSGPDPLTEISLRDVALHAHSQNRQFIGVGQDPLTNSPPWHSVFADVTVDTETGQITVNKIAACHDVGRVINPSNMRGQILGGVLQGVGYALSEQLGYEPKTGRQTHTTMHHYMSPTALDIVDIDPITVEEDDPHGPFGAKGAGETTLVCPASAIVNAASNALGLDLTQVPLTPEYVLSMINRTC